VMMLGPFECGLREEYSPHFLISNTFENVIAFDFQATINKNAPGKYVINVAFVNDGGLSSIHILTYDPSIFASISLASTLCYTVREIHRHVPISTTSIRPIYDSHRIPGLKSSCKVVNGGGTCSNVMRRLDATGLGGA